MGPLTLPDELKKGEYRPLTEEEVQKLKNTGGSSAEKQKKMLKIQLKTGKPSLHRGFLCVILQELQNNHAWRFRWMVPIRCDGGVQIENDPRGRI